MSRHREWCWPVLLGVMALLPPVGAAGREIRAGDPIPDFAFTDFAGNQHHLSDFAGKYVLLDFWATWCLPCLQEIPELKSADRQFRSRGLVIIGMNSDKKQEKAQVVVERQGVSWLQSSAASTRKVVHMLKIDWYPALLLLAPGGKLLAVSWGQKPPLYGPALLPTLEKALPKPVAAASE